MNLSLSEDQHLIRESVHAYFTDCYAFSTHFERVRQRRGIDPDRWQSMAALGWLGMTASQDAGGLQAGPQESMLLLEEAGAALCIEPLLTTVAMAVPLLSEARKSDATTIVLQAVMEGRQSLAVAWSESPYGFAPLEIATTAQRQPQGDYLLCGAKTLVDNGGDADWIIMPARDTQTGDVLLFLVDAATPGMARQSVPMVDGSWAADLSLTDVCVEASHLLYPPGDGSQALLRAACRGLVASCAEALGAMAQSVSLCRDYLHERQQFGRPLVGFQALQHRWVDMLLAEERARSMTLLATIQAANGDVMDPTVMRDLHLAKMVVGQSARFIGAQAIQLHGGMGMAYEYPVGHYYRKLLHCDAAFGTSQEHQSLLAAQLGGLPAQEEQLS